MIYLTNYTIGVDQHAVSCQQSVDSGFGSLDEVRAMMGDPINDHPRALIYGDGENRSAFSDFPFRLEA